MSTDNCINELNKYKSKIIAIFLDLYNSIEQRSIKVHPKRILVELYDYARGSFPLEEKLLNYFNCPKKYKHISEHYCFVNKVNEFMDLVLKDNNAALIVDIFNFLRLWIEDHIGKSDYSFLRNLYNHKAHINLNIK